MTSILWTVIVAFGLVGCTRGAVGPRSVLDEASSQEEGSSDEMAESVEEQEPPTEGDQPEEPSYVIPAAPNSFHLYLTFYRDFWRIERSITEESLGDEFWEERQEAAESFSLAATEVEAILEELAELALGDEVSLENDLAAAREQCGRAIDVDVEADVPDLRLGRRCLSLAMETIEAVVDLAALLWAEREPSEAASIECNRNLLLASIQWSIDAHYFEGLANDGAEAESHEVAQSMMLFEDVDRATARLTGNVSGGRAAFLSVLEEAMMLLDNDALERARDRFAAAETEDEQVEALDVLLEDFDDAVDAYTPYSDGGLEAGDRAMVAENVSRALDRGDLDAAIAGAAEFGSEAPLGSSREALQLAVTACQPFLEQ